MWVSFACNCYNNPDRHGFKMENYTCMVDLLGHVGHLDEAK